MYAMGRDSRATADCAYCSGTSGIIGLGTKPADASGWVGTECWALYRTVYSNMSTDHYVQGEGERVHGVPFRNRDGSQVEGVFAPIHFLGGPEKALIQQPAPKG